MSLVQVLCVRPLSVGKQKQNKTNPREQQGKNGILKDGLGPDQEMLSYPIKFIKVSIFLSAVILSSGFAQRIHTVNGKMEPLSKIENIS